MGKDIVFFYVFVWEVFYVLYDIVDWIVNRG